MRALVLAAGLGTRFLPYTEHIAKPAIPFLNVPQIAYSLHWLKRLSVSEVYINTHHLPSSVINAVNGLNHGLQIEYLHEEELMGSGGAFINIKDKFKDNLFVLNGDTIVCLKDSQDFLNMMDSHITNKSLATLMVCKHPDVGEKLPAIWASKNGLVKAFGKNSPDDSLIPWHFIGPRILSPQVMNWVPNEPSNIFYDVLVRAILKGEIVKIYETYKPMWFETGSPSEYLESTKIALNEIIQKTHFGKFLKEVIAEFAPNNQIFLKDDGSALLSSLQQPQNIDFKGYNVFGEDLELNDFICFENAVIGNGVDLDGQLRVMNKILF